MGLTGNRLCYDDPPACVAIVLASLCHFITISIRKAGVIAPIQPHSTLPSSQDCTLYFFFLPLSLSLCLCPHSHTYPLCVEQYSSTLAQLWEMTSL